MADLASLVASLFEESVPACGDESTVTEAESVFTTVTLESLLESVQPGQYVIINPQPEIAEPPSEQEQTSAPLEEQITPVTTRTLSLTDTTPLDQTLSPLGDSRFNDSLSGLLGSPPPDSPLSRNPFFSELQAVLFSECKKDILPRSLIDSVRDKPKLDVVTREQELQRRFVKLSHHHPEDIRQLSGFYRYQSALVETERYRALHDTHYTSGSDSTNSYYDNQLHQIMDRVEKSVSLLEEALNKTEQVHGGKSRPHLTREAICVMEDWYERNLEHPYPPVTVSEHIAQLCGVTVEQVKKWFANKRCRSSNTRNLTDIANRKRKLSMLKDF